MSSNVCLSFFFQPVQTEPSAAYGNILAVKQQKREPGMMIICRKNRTRTGSTFFYFQPDFPRERIPQEKSSGCQTSRYAALRYRPEKKHSVFRSDSKSRMLFCCLIKDEKQVKKLRISVSICCVKYPDKEVK